MSAAEIPGPVVTFAQYLVTNLDPPFAEMWLNISARMLSVAQAFHAKRGRIYTDASIVVVLAGELRDGDPANVDIKLQDDGTLAVSSKRLGWYIVENPVYAGEGSQRCIVLATVFRPEEKEFLDAGAARFVARIEKLDAARLTERGPQA